MVGGPDTYGSTAVIAVETARRLATGGAEPGVLAPAQSVDPADFLAFLTARGITATIDGATIDGATIDGATHGTAVAGVGSPGKVRVLPE